MEPELIEEKETVTMGDRLKNYEKETPIKYLIIPPYKSFVMRLDGNSFSRYTVGFMKPFDRRFMSAMILTMNDLIAKFNAVTGYTHSDEITLVFQAMCTKEEFDNNKNKSTHLHNGKSQKLNSLVASYCSVRFNYHICNLIKGTASEKDYNEETLEMINSHVAIFDSRIIVFPDDKEHEVVNLLMWRSVTDCHRNAVSTYGRHYMSPKNMQGLHSGQIIDLLKVNHNFDWEKDVPLYYKHGVYGKRELYKVNVSLPSGEQIDATRKRVVNKCFKIKFSEKMVEQIMAKVWQDNTDEVKYHSLTVNGDGVKLD